MGKEHSPRLTSSAVHISFSTYKNSALIFTCVRMRRRGFSNRVDVCVQLQYSDRANINYYDVIIIIATIVKVLQSSVHKRGVCVLLNSFSHFF